MKSPLSDFLRPSSFLDVKGQDDAVGKDSIINRSILLKNPLSLLLFGPPGCGKTTIAKLYAKHFQCNIINLSAIFSGTGDIKKIVQDAKKRPLFNQGTILFVDEIHRFNKAQQDSFLPFIEDGTIILIGATTENPSFSLNDALLSRMRVIKLNSLDFSSLNQIIDRYESKIKPLNFSKEVREYIIDLSNGDARHLLNMIENIGGLEKNPIEKKDIEKFLQRKPSMYDKKSDSHYNLMSALHKSIRGSDPDSAIYYLCRMLEGGEDPKFIIRRVLRMAIEDIGLTDTNALRVALDAMSTYQMLGSPEGELAIAQSVIYLALAPKSNAAYLAYKKASQIAKQTSHLPPPMHILNATTKLMKEFGYSKGYIYDHDEKDAFSGQNYFPDAMQREKFFFPNERGFERDLLKRIKYFEKLRTLKNNL